MIGRPVGRAPDLQTGSWFCPVSGTLFPPWFTFRVNRIANEIIRASPDACGVGTQGSCH